jgi:hypothetical protein
MVSTRKLRELQKQKDAEAEAKAAEGAQGGQSTTAEITDANEEINLNTQGKTVGYFISHQHYNTSRSFNLYCSTISTVITSDSSFSTGNYVCEYSIFIQYVLFCFVLLFVLYCSTAWFLFLLGIYRTKLFTIAFCFATATTQRGLILTASKGA